MGLSWCLVAAVTPALFADDMGAAGWSVVIGAFFLGVCNVVALVLGYMQSRDKAERDAKVSEKLDRATEKVAEVKTDLSITTAAAVDSRAVTAAKVESTAVTVDSLSRRVDDLSGQFGTRMDGLEGQVAEIHRMVARLNTTGPKPSNN